MKASVVSLLLAGLVAAQDFSGQPDCAIPCLKDAIPKAGCALTDTACQCKPSVQTELIGLVGPCLITKCSPSDLGKAQAAAADACKNLANGSSSTSSEHSSEHTAPVESTSAPGGTTAGDKTTAKTSAETTPAETSKPPPTTGASNGASIPTSSPSGISNSTLSGSRSVVTRTSTAFVGGGGEGSPTSRAPSSTTLAGNDATGPVAGVLGAVLAALMAL